MSDPWNDVRHSLESQRILVGRQHMIQVWNPWNFWGILDRDLGAYMVDPWGLVGGDDSDFWNIHGGSLVSMINICERYVGNNWNTCGKCAGYLDYMWTSGGIG